MKISIKIVILSHLSDAQMSMSLGDLAQANRHINFAKILASKSIDRDLEMTKEELDKIWAEMPN